jgi:glycosyltransferase involved in cell wall biosynthesis
VPTRPRVAIVIPAWNEEAAIGRVVTETREALGDPRADGPRIVVVDNGSTDATASVARLAGAEVLSEHRRGYGHACLKGIAALDGTDVIVFMDGDGSDDPSEIGALLAPITRGAADMVIGSRELGAPEKGAHPWHAVVGTRLCVALMNLLIGTRATDLGPFRAIAAPALFALGMEDGTFGWTTEMQIKAQRASLRVVEVPVNYRRRRGGESKISGSWPASVRAGAKILSLITRSALVPGARRQHAPELRGR